MPLYDYHIHSEFSFDSNETLENICISAMEKGVTEIAITDHFDCNYKEADRINLPKYFNALKDVQESFAGRLPVRCGIEIGQAFENIEEYRNAISYPGYDVVLASLHNLPMQSDFYYQDYSNQAPHILFAKYFNSLLRIAKFMDFDILAHLDYPIRYMGELEFDIAVRFKDIIAEILKTVIERDKIIEINTARFDKTGTTSPSLSIIRLYADLGGNTVSTGSDAHTKEKVAINFKDVYGLLSYNGIKYIAGYKDRILNRINII